MPASAIRSTDCPEEREAQSNASDGRIEDLERLGRLVYRRDQITDTGLLASSALPVLDLRDPKRKGLSVLRLDSLDPLQRARVHSAFSKRSSPVHMRLFVASVGEVRKIRCGDGRQVFCVVDDAIEDVDAHALIRLDRPHEMTKGEVREVRKELLGLFQSSESLTVDSDRWPSSG